MFASRAQGKASEAETPDSRAGPDPHAQLNPQQRAAALHADDGPLLVIAGAGSGKTNTLAHRVAHLIERGADPRTILLLTFSRRAAREMIRRVERLVASSPALRMQQAAATLTWAGTFHAVGARLLREFAPRIGLDPDFTIHDREDSADLMNLVRHERGLASTAKRFPAKGTCLAIYSRVVNGQEQLGRVLGTLFPWCAAWEEELRTLFGAYVDAKQMQNVLDYDDLLLYWSEMMSAPAIAAELGARFRHVLVDEYQDTNRLQAAVLLALKPDGRGLTVVGDDAQSIYAFRGATVRNILEFPARFDPPAAQVALEQNYRSTQPLLDAANAVIALAPERFAKTLVSGRDGVRPVLLSVADEAAQARYVVDDVLAQREAGIALQAQAVLFRTSHHSLRLELELARRNVPFVKFGGLKFLESAHVKDVLACLRWADNPRDRIAGLRVLLLLPGVGPRTAARTLDGVAAAADPALGLDRFEMGPTRSEHWAAMQRLLVDLRRPDAPWPGALGSVRLWYEPLLEQRYEDAAMRSVDLRTLESIAGTYATRERFLTELTLDPPDATSDEAGDPLRDEEYLTLSTIHSAKGREWHSVYVLNVVDGCVPSDLGAGTQADLEEERRLLYVAMTRAKEQLRLVAPQRFYIRQQAAEGDRHVYATRTRFIPQALDRFFELRAWPDPVPDTREVHAPACAPLALDIAAKMRGMWRTTP
ncbi:MAG TPA: ATP-dependent helicase [Burkholderiaceae bacterium]|nr:ATP-dependent helicase [Burkholderiaceae bacterium]